MSWRDPKRDENAFWTRYIRERNGVCPLDAYADVVWPVMSQLLERYGISSGSSVLEAGPGWGNYTFRLAEAFAQLTIADVAPVVLEYLVSQCVAQGLMEPQTCISPLESLPFRKQFDALLAVNCFYDMDSLETAVVRATNTARSLVVFAMTSGSLRNDVVRVNNMCASEPKQERRSWRDLFQAADSVGVAPNTVLVPLERTFEYRDLDEAEAAVRKRFNLSVALDTRTLQSCIEPAYTREADRLVLRHAFEIGLVYWQPN